MSKIAKVIVDIALDKEFDYKIPEVMRGSISLGSQVTVPFGRRSVLGYVVGFADKSSARGLKEIKSLASEKPYISTLMLKLARWMADYYCVSIELATRTLLPGVVRKKGSGFKKRKFVTVVEGCENIEGKITDKQKMVLDLLRERGGEYLAKLTSDLGITVAPVKSLEKKNIVLLVNKEMFRDPLSNREILSTKPLKLMPEQAESLELIKKQQDAGVSPKTILLYGVTGSGKTEVYLQAIDHVLSLGKGAIVLVPEISLTPQTVERFSSRFGDRIAVLHSHLSQGERHDEWHRILNGKADIVIGARSAVFAPVNNLGLIVVDEEHEPSYKQEEAPRYSARDVAVMRGVMEKCAVVLGSATPALESWQNAKSGKYHLSILSKRVDDKKLPAIRIIDMRIETAKTGHPSVFSKDLLDAIQRRIDNGEQTILFLNRRGYSTSLVCPSCGHVCNCDNCSVSYKYHREDEKLRCHICGDIRNVPDKCPGCNDPSFKFLGVGTQRVEIIMKKCFPHASIDRMDADVTTKKDAYERILGDFRKGKTDILIGTQMIAKGLHFPNVTLVGVVYADLSLHMPDFRASERTFQLLAQVAGRAGRGDVSGQVIVQTYTPHNSAVQAARRNDYIGFCDQEIEFRKELSYPPFSHLICITLRGPSDEKVAFYSETLARNLEKKMTKAVIMSKATAAPLSKAKGMYRYQIIMRSKSTKTMTDPLKLVMKDFNLPKEIFCTVDVDAISML